MKETKFNIYGTMFHQNGYSRNEILSYIASLESEAVANCKRSNPGFDIISVVVDESKPEIVRMRPLR